MEDCQKSARGMGMIRKRRLLLCLFILASIVSVGLQTSVAEGDDLQSLLDLESKVQAVVAANMESCVAVSDGVGFGSGVVVSEDGLILTAAPRDVDRTRVRNHVSQWPHGAGETTWQESEYRRGDDQNN